MYVILITNDTVIWLINMHIYVFVYGCAMLDEVGNKWQDHLWQPNCIKLVE